MLRNKRLLILIVLILLVLIIVTFFLLFRNPISIVEGKLHIKLPSNTKVINHKYHIFAGDFTTKLEIDTEEINRIRDDMLGYFKEEDAFFKNNPINLEYELPWWDIDDKNVISAYVTEGNDDTSLFFVNRKTTRTSVFITASSDNRCYLYIFIG